jgi:hypothetical protein
MSVSSRQMAMLKAEVLVGTWSRSTMVMILEARLAVQHRAIHSPSKPKSSTMSLMHCVFMPAKL